MKMTQNFLMCVLVAVSLVSLILLAGCEDTRGGECGPNGCCPKPAKTYVLAFSATWCGPCKKAEPRVNALIAAGADIRKVDINASPALASKWRVTSVPTFIVISGGKESSRTQNVSDLGRLLGRKSGVVESRYSLRERSNRFYSRGRKP
jgi:thiol-disulfide isomerase/thioredoxin